MEDGAPQIIINGKKRTNRTVIDMIRKDKRETIQLYINQKQCKHRIIQYILIAQTIAFLSSTLLIFVSSGMSKDRYEDAKIVALVGGGMNVLSVGLINITKMCENQIKKIKKKINKLVVDDGTTYDV